MPKKAIITDIKPKTILKPSTPKITRPENGLAPIDWHKFLDRTKLVATGLAVVIGLFVVVGLIAGKQGNTASVTQAPTQSKSISATPAPVPQSVPVPAANTQPVAVATPVKAAPPNNSAQCNSLAAQENAALGPLSDQINAQMAIMKTFVNNQGFVNDNGLGGDLVDQATAHANFNAANAQAQALTDQYGSERTQFQNQLFALGCS